MFLIKNILAVFLISDLCSLLGAGVGEAIDIFPGTTIQSMVDANAPGASFTLKTGVHRMQAITPKSGNTFIGETGTILSGGKILTGWIQSGNYWYVTGQTQQGPDGGGTCKPGHDRCVKPEDLFIDNVPLEHVATAAAGAPGKWFFDYAADQIRMWNNPAGHVVETSVTPVAFSGWATGVTIRGLVIEKYATPVHGAVQLGSGWVLEDSTVRLNHAAGVTTNPGSIARRNKILTNGQYGFTGTGSTILVENNEIAYNNFAFFEPYWAAGGSKWVKTVDLILRGNHAHHNLGNGLWTDISNYNTLIENNLVEDNELAGIFHEISYLATIRNNTCRRNGTSRPIPGWVGGAGILVVTSPNVQIYGNILQDNWQGITALHDHRRNPVDETHGPWGLSNFFVHHNTTTVTLTGSGGYRTGLIDETDPATYTSLNNRYQDNTYYLPASGTNFIWRGDISDAAWRAAGQDINGKIYRGTVLSACDVNADGASNVNDVQLCANQAIGVSPCGMGDINRDSQCNVMDVQRIVNSALGGQCVTQ